MNYKELKVILQESKTSIIAAFLLFTVNAGLFFDFFGVDWYKNVGSYFEFDKALILKGEVWRIITCHLVHWSPEHFLLDAMVFITLGIVFEQKIGRRYWEVLVVSAIIISLSLLIFLNGIDKYRGISGLINTQFILGIGLFIFDRKLNRSLKGLFIAIFSVHIIKVIYETINQTPFFGTDVLGNLGVFTSLAHLSGAIVGFLYLFLFLYPLVAWIQRVMGFIMPKTINHHDY